MFFSHKIVFMEKVGRVGMYVKEGISFKRQSDLENSTVIKCLWIEILFNSEKYLIVECFYCPLPKTSNYHQSNSNDLLKDHLCIVNTENKETILMGDFNVNYNQMILHTSSNTMFKSIVKLFDFKQLINFVNNNRLDFV